MNGRKLISILLALVMTLILLPVVSAHADTVVEIADYEQLKAFAERVNDGETTLNAKLTEDITCTDKTWTPIGLSGQPYQGKFNGQGYSITGLSNADMTYSEYVVAIGLFGDVGGSAVIQNVAVKNCDLTFDSGSSHAIVYAGAIAAANGGTVENCYCTGTVSAASGNPFVGGVVGANSGTVQNCYNTGTVGAACTDEHGTVYVGGVVGENSDSGTVKNCYNTGTVNAENEMNNAHVYVGGVVGSHNGEAVQNCFNTGAVSGSGNYTYVGGVVGYSFKKVQDCYNTGAVSGSHCEAVGGVVGYTSSTVQACLNTGKVSGGSGANVGGIAGSNTDGSVENCLNTGEISGTETDAGGVVGENFGGFVKYCLSVGTVSGTLRGGVVGWCVNNDSIATTIENCYYLNTAASAAIGAVGTATVTNVYALTAEQLKSLSNCVGFSTDTWYEGLSYPVLKNLSGEVHLYANSNEDLALQRFICAYAPTKIANPFIYANHEFTGWNTDPDGDGDPYDETHAFTLLPGETLPLYAQWREVVNYPLWVGGVQVTSANADDVLGDGTVKFEITEDGENVLTLTNANITGTSGDLDGLPTNIFSSENDYALTVRAVGENSLRGGNYAIQNNQGALTFVGSGKLTAEGTLTGILAPMGITFDGPAVNAKGSYFGVWTVGTLTLKSKLIAEGTNQLAVLADTITLGEGMAITSPAGGYIDTVYDTEKTIYTSDGIEATEVVIEEAYTFAFDEADVQYRGETPYVIADGTAKEPGFTVTDSAGNAIDPAEYEVEYLENTAPGTAYVVVTFQNGHEPIQAFFKIYLNAPESLTVENVESGILLSWEPVEGAAGYVIYRRAWGVKTRGGWTSFERWNNTTETEWIDTEVYAGTRYQYGVKAYFEKRTDPVSGEEIGGNENVPLGNWNLGMVSPLVTNVRLTTRTLSSVTAGTKKMTLKWTGSRYCTGYQIKYATDESFTRGVRSLKIADPAVYQTVVEGLRSNTTYYVTVRSYSEFGGMTYFGEWSNVKSCTVK